jgi:gliding motility-associated-like protein
MKKINRVFIAFLLLVSLSCEKRKLTNDLCDCAETPTELVIDTVTLTIPNIFTPNGDGVNDTWQIKNLNYFTNVSVKINDYGLFKKTIFSSGSQNQNCDGTYNGKPLSDGKYHYEITIGNKTTKGSVCIYSGLNTLPKNNDCLKNCIPYVNDPLVQ